MPEGTRETIRLAYLTSLKPGGGVTKHIEERELEYWEAYKEFGEGVYTILVAPLYSQTIVYK